MISPAAAIKALKWWLLLHSAATSQMKDEDGARCNGLSADGQAEYDDLTHRLAHTATLKGVAPDAARIVILRRLNLYEGVYPDPLTDGLRMVMGPRSPSKNVEKM